LQADASASKAARIKAEKTTMPEVPLERPSILLHNSSLLPRATHSLYSLATTDALGTIDIRSIIKAALESRAEIVGVPTTGSSGTLTPSVELKESKNSPKSVSSS
jgi:hypothetical protein